MGGVTVEADVKLWGGFVHGNEHVCPGSSFAQRCKKQSELVKIAKKDINFMDCMNKK